VQHAVALGLGLHYGQVAAESPQLVPGEHGGGDQRGRLPRLNEREQVGGNLPMPGVFVDTNVVLREG